MIMVMYMHVVTFRVEPGNNVYLRHGGQDIINLNTADKVDVEDGEWFQYFGNFIIVRRANSAYKKIINHLNHLGLSFDGTTVEIITRTRQRTDGPGALYFNEDAGVAFYTTSFTLIQRITDALNSPGGQPTPPPNEGIIVYYNVAIWPGIMVVSTKLNFLYQKSASQGKFTLF